MIKNHHSKGKKDKRDKKSSSSSSSESTSELARKAEENAKRAVKLIKKDIEIDKSILANVLADLSLDVEIKTVVDSLEVKLDTLLADECILISSIPPGGYIITKTGCYKVIAELSFMETDGTAFQFQTGDVSLDLGNFTLTVGPDVNGISGSGINNLVIKNGTILSSSPGTSNIGISLTSVDNFKIKNIHTDSELTGIQLLACTNGRFIGLLQEHHGFNPSSLALLTLGLCLNISFDDCKWNDNVFVVGSPQFITTSAIVLVGPSQNFRFTKCQLFNSDITPISIEGFYITSTTIDFQQPLNSNEMLTVVDCHGLIIQKSTFTARIADPHFSGLNFISGTNMLLKDCVVEDNASSFAPDTAVQEFPTALIHIGSSVGNVVFGGIGFGFVDNMTILNVTLNGGAAAVPSFVPVSPKPATVISKIPRRNTRIEELIKVVVPTVPATVAVRAFHGIYVLPGCTAVRIENVNASHFNSGNLPISPQIPGTLGYAAPVLGGAIRIDGSDGVEILNCSVTDVADGPGAPNSGSGIILGGEYVFIGVLFTVTTAPFIQPIVGGNVTISVADTSSLVAGRGINITGGGFYVIVSVNSPTSVTITNTGAPGNTVPGSLVPSGANVNNAILVPATTNCTVKGCVVTNCSGDGILNQGNGNIIVDNQVANNEKFGIENTGTNNDIANNKASNNTNNYAGVPAVVTQGSPAVAGQNISI